ncbi:unnamed protein product [Mycena citricolor]|uniref:Uncharacterized protein n=1 Tax=Mycena citricolor TaxID=2018698 RepID=A0AAD2Q4G4_9AGAR|nr:unnamed protein product [Mycena citricolor]
MSRNPPKTILPARSPPLLRPLPRRIQQANTGESTAGGEVGEPAEVRAVSPSGAPSVKLGAPRSRPVTPDLSYRQIVAGFASPLEVLGSISQLEVDQDSGSRPGGVVDDGALHQVEVPGEDQWTEVTRSTARTHRERSPSQLSNSKDTSSGPHTWSQAEGSMSIPQLRTLAERYSTLLRNAEARTAADGHASGNFHGDTATMSQTNRSVNSGPKQTPESAKSSEIVPQANSQARAGPSKNRGKAIDPRNWGQLDFGEEFSKDEIEAQREALETHNARHREVKREQVPTEMKKFSPRSGANPMQNAPSILTDNESEPETEGDVASGQTTDEKIRRLEEEIQSLHQGYMKLEAFTIAQMSKQYNTSWTLQLH